MQVEMRILGVIRSESDEDLPGHKHMREITLDMAKLFEIVINEETITRRIDIPGNKKQIMKKFTDALVGIVNMAAGMQLGEIMLDTYAAAVARTGEYGGLMVAEDAPPEVMEALRDAGVKMQVPVVSAETVH
jgi:hypothetical protein